MLGVEKPLQERVDAAVALAGALELGNKSYLSSSSSSAKHDALSASVAAADAVALLAWGDTSEALGAAADASDAAVSSIDDLFLKKKESGSNDSSSSSVIPPGPLRSAEALERAALSAASGKAASALDAAAGALINVTRTSWSEKARPWLSRAAEAVSNVKGGKALPVDAEERLALGVEGVLSATDGKRAGLRAAADAKIAEKLAGGSKRIGEMGILVSLELGNGPFDPGLGMDASSPSSSLLGNATSAAAAATTASASSRVLAADGWDPSLTNTGGPDFYFDKQLVSTRAVSEAFEALVRSRLAADGASGLARRMASAAVALDAERGLFEVRLAWRAGRGGSALASALAAVNDADPRDPCGSWAEHFDVCSALQRSSALNIVGVRARADTAPPGAHAGRMQLGRRLRGGALPSTVGSPQVLYKTIKGGRTAGEPDAQAVSFSQGNLKDLYWFIDKAVEGSANYAAGLKEWNSIGIRVVNGLDVTNTASDVQKFAAASKLQRLGRLRQGLAWVGGAVFFFAVFAAFLPAEPDPKIMASLNTIQVVTNETLSRVKEIQTTLVVIQQVLEDIRSDIAQSSCTQALTTIDDSVTQLRSLYGLYYGPLDFKSKKMAGFVGQLAEYLVARKQPDVTLMADVEKWVDAVLEPKTGAAYHIDFIYGRISGRITPEESVLRQCRKYFVDKVANSGPVPIDDRMLYADITKIVAVSRFVFFLLLSARLASYAFVPHSHHSVVLRRSFPSPSSSFM
jgi:hypothetical protein